MPSSIISHHKIKVNDIHLSYYIKKAQKKEEKVIIFLHGFPFNKQSWKDQLHILEDNTTGIAIDIRGHGSSTAGHGFFSIDLFAKDLKVFIKLLELKKIVLCGVSMGGYIILRTYELISESIEGLILLDTHHLADDNTAKERRFNSINAILKYGLRPFSIGFVNNLFSTQTLSNNAEAVTLIKNSIQKNNIRSICATQLALASRTDSTHVLSKITVPTLLVRGAEDNITSQETMILMKDLINNSSYIEIERSGHLPNLENPSRFNSVLLDFLKKIN